MAVSFSVSDIAPQAKDLRRIPQPTAVSANFKSADYGVQRTLLLLAPLAIRLSISSAVQFTQQKKLGNSNHIPIGLSSTCPWHVPGGLRPWQGCQVARCPHRKKEPGAGKLLSPKLLIGVIVADSQKNRDCPSIRPSPLKFACQLPIGTDTSLERVYGFSGATWTASIFLIFFFNYNLLLSSVYRDSLGQISCEFGLFSISLILFIILIPLFLFYEYILSFKTQYS